MLAPSSQSVVAQSGATSITSAGKNVRNTAKRASLKTMKQSSDAELRNSSAQYNTSNAGAANMLKRASQ